ncbi:hypothetical protein HPB48_020736 [Haemaphysalis longicornis]|uniref:Uncharacterized protein n=1 Tax=Haemaphysalis longicornis TaxID=44386 RepID=A0A9J6G837_HAELO|nr:hypothetical protein HPB48_020736 [Haemaphysalis longicornis]
MLLTKVVFYGAADFSRLQVLLTHYQSEAKCKRFSFSIFMSPPGFSFPDENDAVPRTTGGTTDTANVSHEIPTIHPLYRIDSALVNHTAVFCRAAGTERIQRQSLRRWRSAGTHCL